MYTCAVTAHLKATMFSVTENSAGTTSRWYVGTNQGQHPHLFLAMCCIFRCISMIRSEAQSKRRGGDSNPRGGLSRQQHFQCCSFSHSDTSPKAHRGAAEQKF